uniref:Dynein heavy chain-like protein PF11_0240 n=1 Tax=Anthurium amnicola TaxID=1678845 RepID=A0A1D1YH79_9ARAE
MSETEKPAEDQVTTAANGTGAPENTGVEVVVEKTDEMENGKETATEDEKGANGRKDEDVKMVDAADVKFGEEIERSIDVGEVEPRKTEGEEKEEMDDQEAEEKSEVAQEKHEGVDEKTEHAEDEGDMAEGKNEEFNAEKDDESDEKCEEDGDKSDEIEEKSEKCGEEKTKENEEEKGSSKKRRRGRKAGEKGEGKEKKGRRKVKEMLRTPTASSIDRPVRERKTVERLVEVVEKEPAKGFLIEKGHGTPLKDIPNGRMLNFQYLLFNYLALSAIKSDRSCLLVEHVCMSFTLLE